MGAKTRDPRGAKGREGAPGESVWELKLGSLGEAVSTLKASLSSSSHNFPSAS